MEAREVKEGVFKGFGGRTSQQQEKQVRRPGGRSVLSVLEEQQGGRCGRSAGSKWAKVEDGGWGRACGAAGAAEGQRELVEPQGEESRER